MKCKNIECDNETKNNNVYCSLTCRNIYVNKYLRDYNKTKEVFRKKKEANKKKYYKDPKKCEQCNGVITYEKRDNTFCSQSCSATYHNKLKDYTWGDKIRSGISEYLVREGIRDSIDDVGLYKSKCKHCGKDFKYNRENKKYCSDKCRKEYRRKHLTEYQKYKLDCAFKFNLKDYPNEFNFDLIKEHGWYKPKNRGDNLTGVSRDHIYSIKKGFENNIDPKIISHPVNCQLLVHSDNFSKFVRCDITLEELKQRIKEFDKKYGKYYENKQ